MAKQIKTRGLTAPKGFFAAGTTCGIKASGKPDMAMILSDRACAAAAVFTKNRLPGAPVQVGKRQLRDASARAIVVNSGIANDATGEQGVDNAITTCRLASEALRHAGHGVPPGEVVPSSTGVIGPQLPMDKIGRGVAQLVSKLARGPVADADAARGIMTTDLVPKAAERSLRLGGKTVRLGGIAKGSGMIAPNMATMLVFLTTDMNISAPLLQASLRDATAASFNRISVDGHTSPSDTVVVLANGAAGHRAPRKGSKDHAAFTDALTDLCRDLAYQIIKDGEGATKVFRVHITGAKSEKEADRVGRMVIDSPLVKTAVHGGDPNWGRIVTAAANSGVALTPARLSLAIAETGKRDRAITVFDRGTPIELQKTQDRKLNAIMRKKDIGFVLDLGRGDVAVEWLGCDLSRQYITINADYTT